MKPVIFSHWCLTDLSLVKKMVKAHHLHVLRHRKQLQCQYETKTAQAGCDWMLNQSRNVKGKNYLEGYCWMVCDFEPTRDHKLKKVPCQHYFYGGFFLGEY